MKYALLIGINYKGIDNSELFGCIDDILNMRDMLVNEMKFLEENITILHDDTEDRDLYPNRQNILNKLNEFINNKQTTRRRVMVTLQWAWFNTNRPFR